MRYISKQKEPRSVEETRNASTTDLSQPDRARTAFNQLNKVEIRSTLIREQGGLCAFCMRAINETKIDPSTGEPLMKIAHRTPILVDPSQALSWKNLFGSCDGGQRSSAETSTCDRNQGSSPLTVDPSDSRSIARLRFERRNPQEGLFLTSEDPLLRKDVEQTLNLNGVGLPSLRAAVLKAFNEQVQREHPTCHWDPAVRKRVFDAWRTRGDGKLREFIGVIEKNGRISRA